MTKRRAVSEMMRGFSQATEFFKRLESAVMENGGDYMHIARLAKDEGHETIKRIARLIVNGGAASYQDQIEFGRYTYVSGNIYNLEHVVGQPFHKPTAEVAAENVLTTNLPAAGVYEHYRTQLADLSEFLDYGLRTRDRTEPFVCATIGLNDGKLWSALITISGSVRELRIAENVNPFDIVSCHHKLVVRKQKKEG